MTGSQVKASVGLVAAIVSGVSTAVVPQLSVLPERYKGVALAVSLLGTIAGAITAALNQSLSPNHVSVPVEVAEQYGLVPAQRQ